MSAMSFQIDSYSVAGTDHTTNQDRTLIINEHERCLLAIADGAGGHGDGAAAAEFALAAIQSASINSHASNSLFWQSQLMLIDRRLEARQLGATTLVIVVISNQRVVGSSVGDSRAWLIGHEQGAELTCGQHRKPLLGDGGIMPVPFDMPYRSEAVLLGTDGLFNYANSDQLKTAVQSRQNPADIIKFAQLPNGGYVDDTTAICMYFDR